VFESAGWGWVHGRACSLAAWLADRLTERGLQVLPRGRSTLVSWHVGDADAAQAEVDRLAAEGVVVRSIPLGALVRASVGAWSSEEELERLVGLVAG
jgi:L-cysteine/cystine lyase